MFLSFRMGQAAGGPARGQRLCDIDPVLRRVSKSRVKKSGSPGTTKIYRLYYKKTPSYRYIFPFLTRD